MQMKISTYLICYLGAACGALVLTPIIIRLSRVLGIIDRPSARKVHGSPIPRAGGLAIAMAMVLSAVPMLLVVHSHDPFAGGLGRFIALLIAAGFLLAVGLADDLLEVPSKYKLLALIAASLLFCSAGGRIETIPLGAASIALGHLSWPVTMLWIIGVTVAMNFIDGLDGLASGIAALACAVLALVAAAAGCMPLVILALALLGALCGFLVFNFNPARVFMGDCGSMFIGFVLASLIVLSGQRIGFARGFLLPTFALAIPLGDTLFTFVRRGILQRRSLFSAERGHIHHRLIDMGLRHRHAVLLLYGFSLAMAGAGALAVLTAGWISGVWWIVAAALFGVLFRNTGSSRARDTIAAVKRNRALKRDAQRYQAAFEEMQIRFRNIQNCDQWWKQVCAAGDMMDFVRITMPMTNRDGSPRTLSWARSDSQFNDCVMMNVTLPIRQRRSDGALSMEVEAAANTFLESAGKRIALFSRLMGEHSLADLLEDPNALLTPAHARVRDDAVEVEAAQQSPQALPQQIKVAVVHDFLYTYAGAERVLEQILRVVPQAEVFSLFDFLAPEDRGFINNKPVRTSFIQRLPFARSRHRAYLPLMPLAIEQLDVSDYDVIISSSYVAAKGVLTRPDQLHICYCHSPVRFAWDLQHQYLGEAGLTRGVKSLVARMILHYIRNWDTRTANGVDVFVRNSDFVGRRIAKVYRRRSTTIYPPVDVEKFTPWNEKQDFYLTASRMVPYKRIDVVVEAFSRMPDKRLIVIGEGPEYEKIRALAGPNVRLLGYQQFDRLKWYMQRARAFIFAAEEDFGIVPVEAQACGTPVIAFGRGGATESIVHGMTGWFFNEQTAHSIAEAVQAFEQVPNWDTNAIRASAERFGCERFREQFAALIRREWLGFLADRVDPSRPTGFDPARAFVPSAEDMPGQGSTADVLTPHLANFTEH